MFKIEMSNKTKDKINKKLLDYANEGKGYVAIMAGSGSDDKPESNSHIGKIVDSLTKFGIPYGVHIASAHKQTEALTKLIDMYNASPEPILIVAVAGGTDALSGTASWYSNHPVVSCPPSKPNESCLQNPPGSSNATIYRADNVGKFAAQMFSHINNDAYLALEKSKASKVLSLEHDNDEISEKYLKQLEE